MLVFVPVETAKNLLVYSSSVDEWTALRIDMILQGLVGALMTPAILFLVVERFRTGQPVRLSDAFAYGFRRWGEMLGANIHASIRIGLATLLLVIPGLVLAVWYAFIDQVVALKPRHPEGSLPRSASLTEGYRWKVFWAFCLILGIYFLFSILCGLPFILIDNAVVAICADVLLDIAYPVISLVGLSIYVSLAHGERGDGSWVDRVRWAPEPLGPEAETYPTDGE